MSTIVVIYWNFSYLFLLHKTHIKNLFEKQMMPITNHRKNRCSLYFFCDNEMIANFLLINSQNNQGLKKYEVGIEI